MPRYIDANELKHSITTKYITNGYFYAANALQCIEDAPAANVMKIIRCKDCCFYKCGICAYFSADLEDQVIRVQENDFCSYGEKRYD